MILNEENSLLNATEATGKSFLLVEDEALIRMMLADMLEELGHRVTAEAGSLAEALSLARDAAFDIAILDINLAGSVSVPAAEVIAERGIPFLFASGYSEAGVPRALGDRPMLRKPFQLKELQGAIRALLGAG
jgi:CheY-like chemotaxis protein